MFEEIVESKYRQLKSIADKIKAISVEEIRKSDLPSFAINFLFAEQSLIEDRNTLNSLLEKYVKLSVNYTLRPKWTLINYFFGSYDSKPSDEILKKSEVFGFYRYYTDLITSHIKDNALMFITQDEVKELTEEANKVVFEKLVKETSSIKIKNFFSQIYKLKYGNDREINLDWSIPYLFIKLFLEDKGFQNLLDKFNIIPGLDDSMEIEMKTAIKVLKDKYYVNNDFFVLKDESQNKKSEITEIKNETEVLQKEEEKKTEITENEEEEKTQPVKEEIKIEEDEKPKGIIRIIKNIPTKRIFKEKKITEEKVAVKKAEAITEEKKEEVYEKKEGFGDTDKIKHLFNQDELNFITKKVFKGNRSMMFEVIEELEKFRTWQDASEYLKGIFVKNKVDLYNKYTVLFIDLLNEHFILLEKGG